MYMNDMFDAATIAFLVFITPNRTFHFICQDLSTSKDAADVESRHCSTWVSTTFT